MDPLPAFESLDYDGLARLAQDDPVAYEEMRQHLIAHFIDTAPGKEQPRLRGLQFRIDQVRRLAHTPLAATIKISALMWNSFLTLNEELSSPRYARPRQVKSAKVINFRSCRTINGTP